MSSTSNDDKPVHSVPGQRERDLLAYVMSTSREGDPQNILDAYDKYARTSGNFYMNVGDDKGKILDSALKARNPKVVVEFGGYLGYSAIRIASQLPADAHLYSIEYDPFCASIAQKILNHAKLSSKVTLIVQETKIVIPKLSSDFGVKSIDLLFIDHWKELYLPDIQLVLQNKLLKKGSVVVADNVIYPGAPDYLEFVRNHPHFTNTTHHSHLEYNPDVPDAVEISTWTLDDY